jgi:hypothetical protein
MGNAMTESVKWVEFVRLAALVEDRGGIRLDLRRLTRTRGAEVPAAWETSLKAVAVGGLSPDPKP